MEDLTTIGINIIVYIVPLIITLYIDFKKVLKINDPYLTLSQLGLFTLIACIAFIPFVNIIPIIIYSFIKLGEYIQKRNKNKNHINNSDKFKGFM